MRYSRKWHKERAKSRELKSITAVMPAILVDRFKEHAKELGEHTHLYVRRALVTYKSIYDNNYFLVPLTRETVETLLKLSESKKMPYITLAAELLTNAINKLGEEE